MSDDSDALNGDTSTADYRLTRRGALGLLGAGLGSLAFGRAGAERGDGDGGGGTAGMGVRRRPFQNLSTETPSQSGINGWFQTPR